MTKKEEIIQGILKDIERGVLKKGSKLPSIRVLSQTFQCSKDTVSTALLELKYQQVIYAIPKSGYYVLKESKQSKETKNNGLLNFSNSMPDATIFPYEDFRFCMNQALGTKDEQLFTYYLNHQGLDDLLESLQKLLPSYQIYTKKEQIIVTTGVQQALYILTKIPFPNEKKTILIEAPTYHMMVELIKEKNIPYKIIERTQEGIDFDELEAIFKSKEIKFFYLIPRFHNPLGTTYSIKEKKKIIALAKKYGVYIVEDDYLGDFDEFNSNDPFYYHDENDRVIYLKSFSKIIFPGLRIGCAILPEKLVDLFVAEKKLIDYDTSLLTQKALSLYINSGMFSQHTNQIKQLYKQKAKALYQVLEKFDYHHFLNQATLDTKVVILLNESVSRLKIEKILHSEGFEIDFIQQNYVEKPKQLGMKIDVGQFELSEIEPNVTKLLEIISDYSADFK